MDYLSFYNKLYDFNMISPIWKYELKFIETFISENKDKDKFLILFSIYFSLINDGNTCMSLDKNKLIEKWNNKINATNVLFNSKDDNVNYDNEFNLIRIDSNSIIENYLDKLKSLDSLIGSSKKIFIIENGFLYLRKYYDAKNEIISSIKRLFPKKEKIESIDISSFFKFKDGFSLSNGQSNAIKLGVKNNLIITGGPGTGKTTSILFILLTILKDNPDFDIKLLAPSGKAASRMKESIINTIEFSLSIEDKENYKNEIEILNNLEGFTIHRVLEMDSSTSIFKRNKNNRFNQKTIFVIDEASMIDIELFSYLLSAIDDNSRVFIMGDMNQLPSVDVGSVFKDLLNEKSYLKDRVIRIDESKRFKNGSDIYNLSESINSGEFLKLDTNIFKHYKEFKINKNKIEKDKTPIYYFLDRDLKSKDKEIINYIVTVWFNEFYKDLYSKSINLDYDNLSNLNELFSLGENSRILCCQNEGFRGIKYINKIINTLVYDTHKIKLDHYYPGVLLMVTKNNKNLDLYNGETGIVVKFNGDDTPYFMIKKNSNLVIGESKVVDKIFKKGSFYFYPLRLLSKEDISFAYAITIHKSQGSDYENILIILPKEKGNPLLNRQILYTGITRTKKNTYIVSNLEIINDAIKNKLERDTNIFID